MRVHNYWDWIKLNWKYLVFTGLLVGLSFWGVAKVVGEIRTGNERLEMLINKADQNGRELACIKKALGLEASVSREEFEKCKREVEKPNPSVPTSEIEPLSFPNPQPTQNRSATTVQQGTTTNNGGNGNGGGSQPPLFFPPGQGIIRDDTNPAGLPLGRL